MFDGTFFAQEIKNRSGVTRPPGIIQVYPCTVFPTVAAHKVANSAVSNAAAAFVMDPTKVKHATAVQQEGGYAAIIRSKEAHCNRGILCLMEQHDVLQHGGHCNHCCSPILQDCSRYICCSELGEECMLCSSHHSSMCR